MKKKEKKKCPNITEYSKLVIRAMVILWFLGAIFGAVVILVEVAATLIGIGGYSMAITVHLPELLTYIGGPMGCGIVGYLLKAGFENREKIRQGGGRPNDCYGQDSSAPGYADQQSDPGEGPCCGA